MYGLVGYPLGHSFSEKYFTEKFSRENIDETYRLFPLSDIKDLEGLLNMHTNLNGINVTIPYKQSVLPYLDSLSDDASAIGAVNVVKIDRPNKREKPKLKGFNTDWEGFSRSLIPLLHDKIRGALVLGTGGASKAVIYALKRLGINTVCVSRQQKEDVITYDQVDDKVITENLLIVNTTPLGMYPNTDGSPDIPYGLLTSSHLCYDLVYNPLETKFMKQSKSMGAVVKNGLEMLYLQAELSWKIWNEH